MDSQQDQEGLTSKQDAEQRAREWIAFLDSGESTEADRQRFERWLALDERHRAAYQQVALIWQGAASLEALKSTELREPLANKEPSAPQDPREERGTAKVSFWQQFKRWLLGDRDNSRGAWPQGGLALGGMALASILVVAVVVTQQPTVPETLVYQTVVAEKRMLELSDGSEIFLSPKTQIEVTFTDKQRHIKLLKGEAFFDVAKNPQRPFIVDSRYTQVKVLGTMFNVNSNSYGVTVAVEEGKVQVSGLGIPGRLDAEEKLTGGQQVSISEKGLSQVELIEPENAGAWRQEVRIYQARPLAQVLEDLGRYHSAELVVMDEALSLLPITAVFPTQNVEKMLTALESVLPIIVVQTSEERIEIRAR